MRSVPRRSRESSRAHGFTLIELMIALLIGVFLLGALVTIVQANRTVFGDQNKLSQLQDGERMALTMMSEVVQSAGYFPAPQTNTLTGTLIAAGNFAVGQSVYGTYSATAPGDQIFIRYATAGGDGILNCSGQSNQNAPAAPPALYVNTFYVDNTVSPPQLDCNMNGTVYNLVSGVTNLSVLYGVNTTGSGNTVDTYMTAAQVTSWTNVVSAMIQLTFTNPMYVAGGPQPQTLLVQQVVNLMDQSGPIQ